MREEQKKVIQKEMDRLKHFGIIQKGLTSYSSPVVLVKQKNQNLYQVCSDFYILNEKLVKINHAFPLVRDCIEQLGRKKCHYLSTIDLRDALHTLRLVLSSQKYCGIYIFISIYTLNTTLSKYFTATLHNMYILWSFPKLSLSSLGGEKSIRMYNKKLPMLLMQ